MATKKGAAEARPLRILSVEEFEAVLDQDDLGTDIVPMPEWGKDVAVRIRGLSMQDLWDTRRAVRNIQDEEERRQMSDLHWLHKGIIEPALSMPQIERLRSKSSDAVLRLLNRIGALNGATKEAREAMTAAFPADEGS